MSKGSSTDASEASDWDATRIARLIEVEAARHDGDSSVHPRRAHEQSAPQARFARSADEVVSLDQLAWPDHREFVDNAFRVVLGRIPATTEAERMLEGLLRGDAKTWLLGALRYSAEGRLRAVTIPGLRQRYLAQKLFRAPVLGAMIEWISAVGRLPRSLRYFRAVEQTAAGRRMQNDRSAQALAEEVGKSTDAIRSSVATNRVEMETRIDAIRSSSETDRADVNTRIDAIRTAAGAGRNELVNHLQMLHEAIEASRSRLSGDIDAVRATAQAGLNALEQLKNQYGELRDGVDQHSQNIALAVTVADSAKSRLDAISPPPLTDTLEVTGSPLVHPARERASIPAAIPTSTLSAHARYALFETAFYDSALVSAKQRVYLPYIDRNLAAGHPFLDLGCGRGEFLQILEGEGIGAVGVDINPTGLARLRADGFEVIEQDLLKFLEIERRTFSGASALQVAEHLTSDQIERMLALLVPRLVRGAPLIVETPNPLCPYALGQFHTDPTHVAPLPPERLQFSIEAAGFERARTLFQARAPGIQFAGPDPRAYYMDYAIIACRSTS